MSRNRKKKAEFRYYRMPENRTVVALLGEKWRQNYGRDIDYLHFHNYLEIGYCHEGKGAMVIGDDEYYFEGDLCESGNREIGALRNNQIGRAHV